jgi:dihydrofolate synthase/folylpolyglutamate synthase
MTYRQALERLARLIDYERHPRLEAGTRHFHLEAFRQFLESLGAPHRGLNIIHIAGTRGKGTVATLLAEALNHRGQRVGLFRSPHVDDVRERITVDGHWISRPAFTRQCGHVLRALGRFPNRPDSSFRTHFECLTAIALSHLRARHVDWAVLETGLGGRLDATNVVRPRLTILTALGIDHTHVLGANPRSIAREKAGILKRGVPCLLAPQPPNTTPAVIKVIRERAAVRGVPLLEVGRRWSAVSEHRNLHGQRVRIRPRSRGSPPTTVRLSHIGPSAAEAMATVWAALDVLGLRADPGRAGETFNWPLAGRCEVVRRRPPAIIDGAHCPLSARHLAATLEELAPGPRRVCLAMMEDKDHTGTVRALRLGPDDAVALPALKLRRACEPSALAQVVRREAPACEAREFPTLGSALNWLSILRPAGTTVVTGSFYHLAPARRALRRIWANS